MGPQSLKIMADTWLTTAPSLTSLNIGSNPVADNGRQDSWARFCKAVGVAQLTSLDVSETGIGSYQLASGDGIGLADSISDRVNLKTLNLARNRLTAEQRDDQPNSQTIDTTGLQVFLMSANFVVRTGTPAFFVPRPLRYCGLH